MKLVILAGGRGTRISEESEIRPKPMVEIGEMPILWHIMKYYSAFGINDFIVCCGYKGYMIKEYFANYFLHHADVTFDFSKKNYMEVHQDVTEPWKVTLVDTGLDTKTAGRIALVENYLDGDDFMLTYGDGVSDVDLNKLLKFHKENGKIATITAIQPGGRYGVLDLDEKDTITRFAEKSKEDGGWINGGFMVMKPEIFDYIKGNEEEMLEQKPFEEMAKDGKLAAYKHDGFWQCMDTMRDKIILNELWEQGNAPWEIWD